MVIGPNKRYLEEQAKQRARADREAAKQAATPAEPEGETSDAPDLEPVIEAVPAVDEG